MTVFRTALCCSVLLALTAVAAAQTSPGDVIVNVPFPFMAGKQSFGTGRYILKSANSDLVRIFNSKTTGSYIPTHVAQRPSDDDTKVVFHQYGHAYFLAEIWIKGDLRGRELFRTRAEKELAQHDVEMKLAEVRPVQ